MKNVILYENRLGGYYGGLNKKYIDVFKLTCDKHGAEILSEEDGLRIKDELDKAGYNFQIKEVEGNGE